MIIKKLNVKARIRFYYIYIQRHTCNIYKENILSFGYVCK